MFIGAFSTPLVFARKALRLMNTSYLAALGTGPPFLFVSNEMSYAELPYVLTKRKSLQAALYCFVQFRVTGIHSPMSLSLKAHRLSQYKGMEYFAASFRWIGLGARRKERIKALRPRNQSLSRR